MSGCMDADIRPEDYRDKSSSRPLHYFSSSRMHSVGKSVRFWAQIVNVARIS